MPRRARIALPNVPVHLIQRGNNRQPCFFADEDYRRYLDWLAEYADKTHCRVHAYVLMTNHVHLLRLLTKPPAPAHRGLRFFIMSACSSLPPLLLRPNWRW